MAICSWATDIRGKVSDAKTGEPLIGTTIHVKDTRYGAIAGLDGTFLIKGVPNGEYKVEISLVGYETISEKINVSAQTLTFDWKLNSTDKILAEIVVTGTSNKSSDEYARKFERTSPTVVNVVSARTIEVSPDITVANVMQRISGISMERNSNGDAQYAIVRGMDKRYNYTLVNGIKIPSPDNKNRYVPLDIFPSDLLDRLEVIKALTPANEADAVGGVVNLVMKDAPGHFTATGTMATGGSQLLLDRPFASFDKSGINLQSPKERLGADYLAKPSDFPAGNATLSSRKFPVNTILGASVGNRIFNNKLGFIVSGSYQHTFRGTNGLFFGTEVNRNDNSPTLSSIQSRTYSAEQIRSGLQTKFDYRIAKHHKLSLLLAWVNLVNNEVRVLSDTNLVLGRLGIGYGRISNSVRTRHEIQNIYNGTLQGEHKLAKHLKFNWSGVYSLAKYELPDQVQLDITTGVLKGTDGKPAPQPQYYDNGTFRRWQHNTDKDLAAYYNLTFSPEIFDEEVDLTVGGLYRHKTRENYFNNYNLRPAPSPQVYNEDYSKNTFEVFNPQGSASDPLNYNATEDVTAFYGQFKFEIEDLQILGGARYEHTDFSWATQAPATVAGKTGSIKYWDLMPSLHLKFSPNKQTNWRATYYSSISRPGFYEVIPYTLTGEDYDERGNPYLKRIKAQNIDFRYEFFPKPLDQLLLGVFWKRIQNPIEYALEVYGVKTYYVPENFGTAYNYGFEMDFTKYMQRFGIKANYTFTNSEITTDKTVRYRDGNGNLTERIEQQTRPLQGQSKHIGNLSLLYKNAQNGFDAQFALVYTGRRIATVSPFKDNDLWQRSTVQADFSFEKRLVKHIYLYGKINNLFNTPLELEIQAPQNATTKDVPYQSATQNVLVKRDYYRQTYLLGLRYKL